MVDLGIWRSDKMHSLTRETHQSHGFHSQTHPDRGLFVVSGGQDLVVVVVTADFVVSCKNFVEVTVNQVCTTASSHALVPIGPEGPPALRV